MLRVIFDLMVRRLSTAVPDLGTNTSGDATGLNTRRPRSQAVRQQAGALPQPADVRKECTNNEGRFVKMVEWFGYKLHLLVDTRHEGALAYSICSTKVGDNEILSALVKQGRANLLTSRVAHGFSRGGHESTVHSCPPPLKRRATHATKIFANREEIGRFSAENAKVRHLEPGRRSRV